MKITTKEQLDTCLKEHELPKLWVFNGNKELLKNKYAHQVCERFVTDESREVDYTEMDGNFLSVDTLAGHLSFYPFVGEYRVAYVKGLSLANRSSEDLQTLLDLIADLPESSVLVITMSPVKATAETEGEAKAEDSGAKKLIPKFNPSCDKAGVLVTIEPLNPEALIRFTQKIAKDMDAKLDKAVARTIIERCGGDMLLLSNEVAKLASVAMHGEITAELVDEMVPVEIAEKIFYIVDDIIAGNNKKAISRLEHLLGGNENEFAIWGAICFSFTELAKAAAAYAEGVPLKTAAGDYGFKDKTFVLEKNMKAAARVNSRYPGECLKILLEYDAKMKSTTGVQPAHLILQAMIKIGNLKRN